MSATLLPNRAGDTERHLRQQIRHARREALTEAAELARTKADVCRFFGNDPVANAFDKLAEELRDKAAE